MFSPEQVAAHFNVSRQTVYNWIHSGALKALRLGGLFRVTQAQLDAFVKES